MIPLILPWFKFIACAAAIAVAGPFLIHYGDVISRLTGLSRSWIGLVLLATATSLPELFTGVSAVTIADTPDIAVGNALGSCIFNLAMLVILDVLSRDEPFYRFVEQGHILTAGFGIILIGSAGVSILLGHDQLDFHLSHVGVYTPLIIILYFVAMRASFIYERRTHSTAPIVVSDLSITLRSAFLRYLGAAAVVVAAGAWLPFVGVEIADTMGWRTTFVGTLLIAGATSLPELVVTVSALRLAAADMAVANLLGSNLFNVLTLAINDLFFWRGPLLSSVSPAHAVSAFAAVIMSGIFIIAILYRPQTRFRGTIGWVSISLLLIYLLSAYASYLHGS